MSARPPIDRRWSPQVTCVNFEAWESNVNAGIEITDATFEAEVLRSPVVTIVDLWAEWCAPCKALVPVLDQIDREYQDKVKVTKLDVDGNPTVPARFGVTGIPAILIFKGGQLVETIIGFVPKDRLVEKLLPHLYAES